MMIVSKLQNLAHCVLLSKEALSKRKLSPTRAGQVSLVAFVKIKLTFRQEFPVAFHLLVVLHDHLRIGNGFSSQDLVDDTWSGWKAFCKPLMTPLYRVLFVQNSYCLFLYPGEEVGVGRLRKHLLSDYFAFGKFFLLGFVCFPLFSKSLALFQPRFKTLFVEKVLLVQCWVVN